MDIAVALAGITQALSVVNELRKIDHQINQAELKLQLAEVISNLADAKLVLVDAEAAIRGKDEAIIELRSAIRQKEKDTIERNGYRYRISPEGNPVGTPFCPICLDEGKFRLTVKLNQPRRPLACPDCESNFGNAAVFRANVD